MPQKIQFSFADQSFTATLQDNPTARDFLRLLPLDLKIEDYGTNEKIVYLPEKLTQAGATAIENPSVGDICYFAPWGNLALYHGSYGNYPGLIRLGKLDGGPAPLLKKGTFPLQITILS
ncbi:MAG: MFS transporter [Rhodobacteraceae bacterium PARR1]|nr:MAG: MFS transporter [Rhodobacteraceae bacterium PARR1]